MTVRLGIASLLLTVGASALAQEENRLSEAKRLLVSSNETEVHEGAGACLLLDNPPAVDALVEILDRTQTPSRYLPAPHYRDIVWEVPLSPEGRLPEDRAVTGRAGMPDALRDALEAITWYKRCAVGLAECSDEMPCPLHESWKGLREKVMDYLRSRTVADLATALRRKQELLGKAAQAAQAASG